MRTYSLIRKYLAHGAALGVVAMGIYSIQPIEPARGGDIFSGVLLDFQGGSRLSSRNLLSNAPNIGIDQNNKALRAYNSGDFATARGLWEEAAGKGDIYAMFMLAQMYRFGQGVNADDGKAFEYYQSVAKKFNGDRTQKTRFSITVDSHYWIAKYYMSGIPQTGVKKSPKHAFKIFKFSANHGHPAAQYEVGRFFLTGKVIKRNNKLGKRWVRASATKRHAPAMAMMGSIYWSGQITKQSRAHGLMWYMLARENACQSTNPEIFDDYEEFYTQASDEERSVAQNNAMRWNQQNPLKDGQLIYRVAKCN